MKHPNILKAGVAPLALSLALVGTPAFAQDDQTTTDTAIDEDTSIVVTGSLIRNPNLERSAPVNVTTSEEIELLQSNVAEEVLREIPGVVPSIGSAVNNGNGGASFVNLRGLGANRNLVLVDNFRLVPSGLGGVFDLNNIPLSLLERVDVLTGGASTTYGADAISGVVNFITRRDFAGLEVAASQQITEEGDGSVFRIDATIGANFDDGRGNAVLGIGYQEADPVFQGARDVSLTTIETFTGTALGSGTSVPSRFTVPGRGTLQIQPSTGNLVPTFQTFNFNPFNVFQTPFERYNIYGAANYEVSDAVEVYTRGIFSKNTVDTIIAPSGAFGISVQIPLSNPFLPVGARNEFCARNDSDPNTPGIQTLTPAQCAAAATATSRTDPNYREITTTLFRRSIEAGPRTSEFVTTFFDYRLGLRGPITETINWDLSGGYGESENIQTIGGYFLNSRVRQSLLTTRDASGAFVCQNTANGCVPANFFGEGGSISAEAVDFLVAPSTSFVKSSLAQVRGVVSGDFGFALPWATDAVAFAVAGEYRKYDASQGADSLAGSGDLGGAGGATPSIEGGYDVREAVGELIVPLVQDRPFFNSLTVEGGVRYSSYSVDAPNNPTFDTWTYKAGVNWEPVDGFGLRATYARAVRAPNIAELFSPVNTGLTNLGDDPCASVRTDGTRFRPAPTGELRAVCLAQGAAAFNIDAIPEPISGQVNATGGGNLNLVPETSDSYTVGVIFQPTFLPGFTATVDYYKIEIRDAISAPTPGDVIAACFGTTPLSPPSGASATPACTDIRRDPATGGLSGDPNVTAGLPSTLSNSGSLETEGIDVVLNYRTDLNERLGLAIGFNGNYTFNSRFNAFVASPLAVNRDCTGFFSVNCGSIQPEFQFSQRTTLTIDDSIDISLLWRHIDEIVQEPLDVQDSGPFFQGTIGAAIPGVGGRTVNFGKIEAYDYFDLTGRFTVSENLVLTLTVQNLFDKEPPLVGNNAGSTSFNSGNTFPSTYDALGRRYAVSAKLRF
jgi:outer membrane receptor protein involved in Fe transport